jgi:hypothetical protein
MLLDHTLALLPEEIKRNAGRATRSQRRKSATAKRTVEVAHGPATVARLLLGNPCRIRREARKLLTGPIAIKRRKRSVRIEAT